MLLFLHSNYGKWSVGQGVKTPPFHGGITGSIPVRSTSFKPYMKMWGFFVFCIWSVSKGAFRLSLCMRSSSCASGGALAFPSLRPVIALIQTVLLVLFLWFLHWTRIDKLNNRSGPCRNNLTPKRRKENISLNWFATLF